ncbi:DNA polymerase III, beta subunit [Geoalkalibacter ferrihydriticus]|uniref:Beta sliding clamp n=2 Tax=Geoalkalibacter ferrihydriticus TaxID=392333 RepID=A0A0C2HS74_9BACT|nr:DNA polymerase III subunit beta [Geoalkalibacter ferrihydriticus]KIH77660.1 DNA polymerase III subunit beta [Geoalkalibacter ferrihydriticus DSM 17813]SDL72463.1 DNA polymerase III, beta subunit [Geoalkalibacter ferrihydriticus]
MNFKIEKQVFLKGLAKVQGIVERKNTIPVLANVLIEAGEETVCLTATDLEVGMKAYYPAQIEAPGRITVSAKKLFEIIRELPEGEISFKAKDNCWIEIRCGKALFNLVGLSPEEFPHFPKTDQSEPVILKSAELAGMIEKTAFAMSTDETKYNLNGLFFRYEETDSGPNLFLVATDGHRLTKIGCQIPVSECQELRKGIIFPRKGINELRKLAEEGEADIQLSFRENSAVITKGTTTILMRLVDGQFPDYERVIPKTNDLIAEIPAENFCHALRRMSTLASEKSRGIKVSFKQDFLEISSSNPELGDAREEMEISYQGPEIALGFNARYLTDILQANDEEKILFKIKDNISPGLITPGNAKNYLAVIMPMRL